MSQKAIASKSVNWKQVSWFVGLTMALSWLVDLVLWRKFGYGQYAAIFLQLQMLIPALVAIVLQRYAFKDSPIYYRNYQERPRWFFSAYIVFTLFFTGLVVATMLKPALYPAPLTSLVMVALVVSLVVLVVIRVASGKGSLGKAGISGGKWTAWLFVWLAVMGYHGVQILLNMAFDLGFRPDILALAESAGMDSQTLLIAGFVNTVIVGPFLGLWIAFGEEYGWRGYLQGELTKLGRVKGVLLVGVVWGVWHAPAVMMGHNYPGYPVLGPLAFLIFNLFLAIFLGYVMFKTGSVWLAAFMHALINQGYQWLTAMVFTPNDPLFSFGAGFYGIAFALLVSLLILRDRVWKQE